MKKIISVLLCIAMMFTFLTVISCAAADGATDGSETIWDIIIKLMTNANWADILKILVVTIQTFLRMIGAAV